ncbi:MAG: hypothetical protein Q4E01_06835, partial [Actinomycetaceae bacterium]|nr:hypothetical protein [Actinomycetaceae bacterium]
MKRANWKKAGISAVSAFGLVAASVVAGSGVANAQEMGGAAGAQNAPIVGKAPAIHERSGISVKAVIPVQPLAGQAYTCAFQAGPHGLLIEPSLAEGGCKIYGIPVYDTGGEQTYEVIVGFPGSNYPEERRVGSYYIGKNVAPAPGGAAENLGDAKGEADDSRGGEGEAEGVQPGNDALNDLDGDKDGVSDAS